MSTTLQTSRNASIALGLTAFGFVWTPMSLGSRATPPVQSPFESGYTMGHDVIGPLLPWIVGALLAVACVAKERGEYRIWPAWTSLGIIFVCFAIAIPTFTAQKASGALAGDVHLAQAEAQQRMARFNVALEACDAAARTTCSIDEAAAMPQAAGLNIRLGTDCRIAESICYEELGQRSTRIEQVLRAVPGVGMLRVEGTYDVSGRPTAIACRSLDPAAQAALVAKACGQGSQLLPAPTTPASPSANEPASSTTGSV